MDAAMLEHCVREDLNETAIRRMAVLDPVLVEIENWDEGKRTPPNYIVELIQYRLLGMLKK